jgi:uncharacterized membrane protein
MQRKSANRSRKIVLLAGGMLAFATVIGVTALKRRSSTEGAADSAPGRTARQSRFGTFAVVGRTVTIDRPRAEVYAFCRDFSQLGPLLSNVTETRCLDGGVTRWVLRAPAGLSVTADTEMVSDRQDEEISWQSVDSSQIETKGKIVFRDARRNRGTKRKAIISYKPPGGELGRLAGWLTATEPGVQSRHALKRLKMLLETGEVATARHPVEAEE